MVAVAVDGASVRAPVSLTVAEAARIVREAKDKSYQSFPLGAEWAEFLRAKRLAQLRPNTLESYETVGDKFARYFADFESLEPFAGRPELVLDFLEATWPDVDPDTLHQRFAVMGSFFDWAYRTDRIDRDPMGKIERPKRAPRRAAKRSRISEEHLAILVSAQATLRDQCGLLLLGRLGLRREDLRLLQLRDLDLGTDEIHLRHAKGGREHTLPIAFKSVRDLLYLHAQERGDRPDEYLVYPKTSRTRPFSPAGIDAWFGRCLERAALRGYTMHQLRHAAIDEVRRKTHDVEIARQLARHANLQTTQEYLHSDLEELRKALETIEA
jgi:site-specific recombinase XerD